MSHTGQVFIIGEMMDQYSTNYMSQARDSKKVQPIACSIVTTVKLK